MIYCPHYLTRVVTPANQCVITVIIVIMFLQTRYTWRHTRPHLMTITASFLQQMILVRRYFNQIISSYPLPSLNNITSIMWPPSHSKETISSHIVIKSNIELSSSSNILKGKALSSSRSYFLLGCYHVVTTSHKCIRFGVIVIIVVVTVTVFAQLSLETMTLTKCHRGISLHSVLSVHWSLFIVVSAWSLWYPGLHVCVTMFV